MASLYLPSDSGSAGVPPIYQRVLLKLSGEALMGGGQFGIDPATLSAVAEQVRAVHAMGVAIGIVVGGGNYWRGETVARQLGMEPATAHYAGMLATVINALALQEAIENAGVTVRTQTALSVHSVAEPYIRRRAIRHLEKGRVVIFGAGTGNPFMTTDTAAALRAVEIGADVLLMAKNGVNGVYDDDPRRNPAARRYQRLSYTEALTKQLAVMDSTALSMCRENTMPIFVFDIGVELNIVRAVEGVATGTLVSANDDNLLGD